MPEPRERREPHEGRSERDVLAAIADEAGLRRVHFVAWRDLDDPEAGGSELHAHKVASLWAAAGLDVTFRTSAVPGAPAALTRDGYRVLRRAGRYAVFPGAAWEGLRMGHRPGDALVEIWNGMPFLSPLWYRGPSVVFLHHVHAEMWGMVLPPTLARMGDTVERRIAPRFYRSSRIVTLSESSRHEIVDMLHLPADRVTVAPPGVDERYSPGGQRSADAAGGGRRPPGAGEALRRLTAGLGRGEGRAPGPRGGDRRRGLRAPSARGAGATSSERPGGCTCPGRVSDEELVDWYRRAWVVASSSQREGWGMTLTEAAACGTPAVATDIAGHADAVVDGESGLLVENVGEIGGRARPRVGRRGAAQPAVAGRLGAGPLVHVGRHGPPRPRGAGGRGDVARDGPFSLTLPWRP